MITLNNIAEYVLYERASCAAPNDRALMIYRRAVNAGIVASGEKIIVRGDLDDVLNKDDWQAFVSPAIPPAPCPPEPPVDPDDTQPITIPPRPSRARRMMHVQAAMWSAAADHIGNIIAVIDEGIQRGHLFEVVRPDGEIGIGLTEAGYDWLESER